MIDFLTFTLQNIQMTADRKAKLKTAYLKQVGWTAKITDPDNPEKLIDNPVTFQETFNKGVTNYIKETAIAGQQKIDQEAAVATDSYPELV